jgi:hypothetical protein
MHEVSHAAIHIKAPVARRTTGESEFVEISKSIAMERDLLCHRAL